MIGKTATPLPIFDPSQQALVNVQLAQLCSTTWNQGQPTEVVKPHEEGAVAVCLPKLWFDVDGKLSPAGQSDFTAFMNNYLKHDVEGHISIVRYSESALSFSAGIGSKKSAEILAHQLGNKGYRVTGFQEKISLKGLPLDGSLTMHNAYTVHPLKPTDVGPTPKRVTLFIPPIPSEN